MDEIKKEEPVKDVFQENRVAIQTLFTKLLELIMDSSRTRKNVADLIVVIGNWTGMAFATLIVMVEGKDIKKADIVAERIARSLQADIKNHVRLIRGMKNKAAGVEENRIIVPDHLK